MITGGYKVKKQKNGNVHEYVYYHCTKKNKAIKCTEPCIRQEELDNQISALLQKFSLRQDWAAKLTAMLEKEKTEAAQSSTAFVQEAGNRIRAMQTKLQRLLDGYLEQDIERAIYRTEKAKLLSKKKSLEEQMARIEQKQTCWLELMQEWIKEAGNPPQIAREANLRLGGREARLAALSAEEMPAQNAWAALCAANEKVGQFSESQILVRLEGIEPPPDGPKPPTLSIKLQARLIKAALINYTSKSAKIRL